MPQPETSAGGKSSIFKSFTQGKVYVFLQHILLCHQQLQSDQQSVSPVILAGGLSHLRLIVRVPAPSLATRLVTLPLNADNVIIKTADEHELSSLWQQKASFTGGRIAMHHPGLSSTSNIADKNLTKKKYRVV